jgi:protein-S-isoprenylcysteine O-methyltransferase Ste14
MSYIVYEIILPLHVALNLFWFMWRFSFEGPRWLDWSPRYLIDEAWFLFAAFWLIAALRSKRASRTERPGERLVHIVFMVFGFLLLYNDAPSSLNWLNRSFVSEGRWIEWSGAWLTLAGVLFAIWARVMIGRQWSAEIQIKEGHELIRSGPYAYIRHPIYTGILIAFAGTALATGEYRGILALIVVCIGFARKARKEEAFLAQEFGPAFEEHRRCTGFFLPRLS